jgi:beta-lactamase regulating signal transducer with metallopeptidase domain
LGKMSVALLQFLGVQTVVLGAVVLALAALRPLLLRGFGAANVYLAWCVLPLCLLAACMPTVATPVWVLPPLGVWSAVPQQVAALLPRPSSGHGAVFFALAWVLGFLTVLMAACRRHGHFLKTLTKHPFGRFGAPWQSAAGSSPAQLGWWRSQLVLPSDFEQQFGHVERRLIVLHELLHARRGDNAWNLLATVFTAMHWFNPLAWWALRRMRVDQELACDAWVLGRHPRAARHYAMALLKSQGLQRLSSWVPQWQCRHPLVERVAMLKRHPLSPRRRAAGRRVVGLLALWVAGVVYAGQTDRLTATDNSKWVEIKFEVQVGSHEVQRGRMLTRLGVPATLEVTDDAGARWRAQMTTTRAAHGQLQIDSDFSTGTPPAAFSKHRQITPESEAFALVVGDPKIQTVLHLHRVVRLVAAADSPQK